MALKLDIDADALLSQFTEFKEEIKKNLELAIENLTTLTRAHIVMQAASLSSPNNKTYLEALSEPERIAQGVWVISLDEKALWIEEGIKPGMDMKPGILKGRKTAVVPFKYDKPESQNTPMTQGLVSEIKQKLKKEGLSISKIENNDDGSPRVSKKALHTFNFTGPGSRMSWVKRNPKETHPLSRVNIYQTMNGQGKVRRDVVAFRTVSSGPASEGKWIHPGYEAKKFMDRAMEKAVKDWEQQILPDILEKWNNK